MKLSVLFVVMLFGAMAQAQDAKVRASLKGEGDPWVGQRVEFVVELMAPGFFASAAAFDLPDPPGLLLMPPTSHPVVGSETIDGTNYTVQRHELSAIARRAGAQTIPALTARFSFKRSPLDKNEVIAKVQTEPLHFTAKLPPGAEKLGGVISARNLKVEESWSPNSSKAQTGDAFTRTVTFTAPEVPAMAFPPFPSGKIDGLGIYPAAPEVLDVDERGSLTGKRRDKITYVCERAGQFTIPAARLTWFDLDAQQLRTIDFPARTLQVAANPAMAASAKADTANVNQKDVRSIFVALGAAIALNGVLFALWRTRAFWRRVTDVFRPVHLAPLNPTNQSTPP